MAGHNKWSKVKHFSGALDAKRGKLINQQAEEITFAVQTSGGSPNGNPRLHGVTQAARPSAMANPRMKRRNDAKNVNFHADTLDELPARIAG